MTSVVCPNTDGGSRYPAGVTADFERVRPTRRCLNELTIAVPSLDVILDEIDHPLILKAQQVPTEREQHSAKRVVSLTDRVWFKVKAGRWRGAAADLSTDLSDRVLRFSQRWWLATAGTRVADSSQADFYSTLKASAFAHGAKTCDTGFLLPSDWDERRLMAEAATLAQRLVSDLVLNAAAQSITESTIVGFTLGDRDVRARIQVLADGQAYVAIGATGSVDASFFVTLISAFPGMTADDWMIEPSGSLALEPAPGEILWSAMLPPAVQRHVLDR